MIILSKRELINTLPPPVNKSIIVLQSLGNNECIYRLIDKLVNEDIIVNEDLDNGAELNEANHVRMDIIEDTLTNTGCKIRITDYTNNLYIYILN